MNTPFSLMDASGRETYWQAILDSAGDFVKEVLVGIAADLMVQRIALIVSAPREAERARHWLERPHDLETYLTAAEFTGNELERLVTASPLGLVSRERNWLDDATIKSVLDLVTNHSLQWPEQTHFGRLIDSLRRTRS